MNENPVELINLLYSFKANVEDYHLNESFIAGVRYLKDHGFHDDVKELMKGL